jgi:hypothetical protein
LLTAAVLLVALAATPGVPATGAWLSSTGTATASVTSAAACASGTPYATAVQATAPSLWWRFGEDAGATTVADDGPDGLDGQLAGTDPAAATTLGAAGLPECDTTGALQLGGDPTGDTGYVVLPVARPEPTTMSVAVWLQAAPGAGGGLLGFGDSATGLSASADRVLALDSSGRVTFTVLTSTGPVEVRSSTTDDVTDGTPHLVAATVSPAGGGEHDIRLYVDGERVDEATGQVLATGFPGFWRTGDPRGPGADAVVDELTLWEGGALTEPEIAALAAADHW